MKITKKILSMILTVVMVLGLLPATAFATEAEYVYISVSYDDKFTDDKNGNPILHKSVGCAKAKHNTPIINKPRFCKRIFLSIIYKCHYFVFGVSNSHKAFFNS